MPKTQKEVIDKIVRLYDSEPKNHIRQQTRFFIQCLLSKVINSKKAGHISKGLRRKIINDFGSFSPATIAKMNRARLRNYLSELGARRPEKDADEIKKAAKIICKKYNGKVGNIFKAISAREVYWRLMEFEGIGEKIANMAVIKWQENFGCYKDMELIDLPADRQNNKVLIRLGILDGDRHPKAIREKIRNLAGEDAYKLDYTWTIGKYWCKDMLCHGGPEEPCPLERVCPKNN